MLMRVRRQVCCLQFGVLFGFFLFFCEGCFFLEEGGEGV